MLPFLGHKKEASVSAPASVIKREPDEPAEYDALEAAGADLISAVKAEDAKGVAMALRAAFQLADSEPHVEGEHLG